jgi:hypothetical protein
MHQITVVVIKDNGKGICILKHHAMKVYGGVELKHHTLLEPR